jgi:hypothetical protein
MGTIIKIGKNSKAEETQQKVASHIKSFNIISICFLYI